MPIRTVVQPPVEPVPLEVASLWCRATPEDWPLVEMLVKAARERAENTTHRVYVQRTMEWTGSGFYALDDEGWTRRRADDEHYLAKLSETRRCGLRAIELVAPTQTVESVTYLDPAGVPQTLDPSLYALDVAAEPAVLRYRNSVAPLPQVMPDRPDAVRVLFVAGYPPDQPQAAAPDFRKNLPAALLAWMQIQVSTWYTQRESLETGGRLVETSRNFVEALLDGLVVHTRYL